MEIWEIQKAYDRWWLNKYIEDGRRIVKVEYVGNKVYGVVVLTLDDGSTMHPPTSAYDYRPRKKRFKVYNTKEETQEVKDND